MKSVVSVPHQSRSSSSDEDESDNSWSAVDDENFTDSPVKTRALGKTHVSQIDKTRALGDTHVSKIDKTRALGNTHVSTTVDIHQKSALGTTHVTSPNDIDSDDVLVLGIEDELAELHQLLPRNMVSPFHLMWLPVGNIWL
jgi:hypothetical protein